MTKNGAIADLYGESSAVLAWLMGEPGHELLRDSLARAERVVASDLTLIECARTLIRLVTTGAVSTPRAEEARATLQRATNEWLILPIAEEVAERSRQQFPTEPVRTLDAIHLATALLARRAAPDLVMLSLDDRIRRNASRLGFRLLPR